MKSVSDTARMLLGGRRGRTAPRGQDPARDQDPADDLEQRHPLGEEDEREDGGDERLQVRDERRARGADPVDDAEPEQIVVTTSGPSVAKASSTQTFQPRP